MQPADRARVIEANLSRVMAKLARFEAALQRAHEGEQQSHYQSQSKRQKRSPLHVKELPDLAASLAVCCFVGTALPLLPACCLARTVEKIEIC